MSTLVLLNPQFYQALEKVIMNHRVHYFHDLGLPYFYRIKAMPWITADYLQWILYVKAKSRVYMCIKKTSTKLSRPSYQSLGIWKRIFFIFVFYPLYFTSWRYPNTSAAVKGYYSCRFFNVNQFLSPAKVIRMLIIMKINSFSLQQSGWMGFKIWARK